MIIYLKDKSGNDIPYENVETITFDSDVEGGLATFTYGNAETKTVELQMVDGDMCIVADDGTLLKEITILKPDTLVAENIKIGTLIAGVEGTFIGNGVEKTVDLNFIDDSKVIVTSDESEVDALRMDESNVGKYVKYEGSSEKYVRNTYYEIVTAAEFDANDCSYVGSTYLGTTSSVTKEIECNVGDLLIGCIWTTGISFTLGEGWHLIYTSPNAEELTGRSNSYGSNRMQIVYKYALKETEQLKVIFDEASTFDAKIVSFSNAVDCSSFECEYTCSTGANSITLGRKQSDLLLWFVTSDKGTPQNWTTSSDVRLVASSLFDYTAVAIDNTNDTSITFSFTNNDSSNSNIIMAVAVGITLSPCAVKEVNNIYISDTQQINADENTLMKTVIVDKPETLIPENIISGVNIGGIVGTFEAPQLSAPTAIGFGEDSNTNLYRLTVSYPQFKNGQFGKRVQIILANENGDLEIVAEKDITHNTSQTSATPATPIYANDFFCGRPISGKRMAKFLGDGLIPSDIYSTDTTYSLGHLVYNVDNATVEPEYEYGFYEDALTMQITADNGYYLPKAIQLETPSGEVTSDFTYDYDTGELVIYPKQPETINVNIATVDIPWLRTPYLYVNLPYKTSDPYLRLTYIDPNANNTTATLNGEVILENLADNRAGLIEKSYQQVSGASYGFSANGSYYKSNNTSTYTASLHQVNLNMKTAGTITIQYVNYGYSNHTYGIIGKVDAVLSTSYATDIDTSSTNVYTAFKSSNSTTAKTLTMSVPAGEHFIQFKFRRYSTSSSSYYFQYYVTTTPTSPPTWSLAEHITNYGSFPLQIQSFADGYTDSDISTVNIECKPTIAKSGANLSLSNIIDGVTDIEFYIDDELISTIPYTDGMTINPEELASDLRIDRYTTHSVSVSAVGEGIASNRSNSLSMYLGAEPVYGVSGLYSSTVALTRLEDATDMTYTVNTDGTVTSDFDSVFPWNEAKIVYDEYNNKFIQMPRMYFSVTTSSNYVSSVKVSKTPHASGTWYEVKPFCYGCYGGYLNSDKLESKSGKVRTNSKYRYNFTDYAVANGDKYHLLDLYHSTVMKFLWWIEFATKDSSAVMTGRINGSGTSGGSTPRTTGGTDKLTTPSGYETAYKQMRWHYIEDFVGNLYEYVDGVRLGYKGYASYVTDDYNKYDLSASEMTKYPFAYALSGTSLVKGYWWTNSLPFLCLPDAGSSSTTTYTTYFCDAMSINSSGSYTMMYAGSSFAYSSTNYGLSYQGYIATNSIATYTGGRLLYRGELDDTLYDQTLSGSKLTVTGFESITQTETGIEVE